MIIPKEIYDKYALFLDNGRGALDADLSLFLDHFSMINNLEVPIGSKILCVGAHDEPTANMLADCGYEVTGIDLRSYDRNLPPCNYQFIQADFCNLPKQFRIDSIEKYDAIVCLSSLEHFGMCAYGEGGRLHLYYDVIAMRYMWEYLRDGGKVYITVPFGCAYMEVWPHWRIYDIASAEHRIVQDFILLRMDSITAADIIVGGKKRKAGEHLSSKEADSWCGMPPHVQTILVLEKRPSRYLSPN